MTIHPRFQIQPEPLPKTPVQVALERKLSMNRPTHLDLADLDMDALGW